ncbi:MAG TPA: hypothetical protein VE673_18065 [Pseudonocardiaceae bacterium]|nr:hypothetical protein [Pseudonocardiaceae bacterium]
MFIQACQAVILGSSTGQSNPGRSEGERAGSASFEAHAAVGRGLMHRRRLVQALDGAARHRLTLLVAPCRLRSDSLLADWHTAGQRERVGWLALDPEDSDPVRFWTYLIAAVRIGLL